MSLYVPTYYEILGVKTSAGAVDIRAAYLNLMKLCHPDVAQRPCLAISAEDVNLAYSVIRDPFKRCKYDAEIARQHASAARCAPAEEWSSAARYQMKYRKVRPGSRRWGLVLCIGAGIAFGWGGMISPSTMAGTSESQFVVETREDSLYRLPGVRHADIAHAVSDLEWITVAGDLSDYSTYSWHCFNQLREQPSLRLLDRCVAFDVAASYLLPKLHPRSYFSPAIMTARHAGASRRLPQEAAVTRLLKINELTLSTSDPMLGAHSRSAPRDRVGLAPSLGQPLY